MGDHAERKMGLPPMGFTSVQLPQYSSSNISFFSGSNDRTGGGHRGSTVHTAGQDLGYSHTQMRDSRGDSDSESDPDLDPATLLNSRISAASYFKNLLQLQPQPQPQPPSVPPQVEPSTVVVIRYRECQKNHAAAIGGHAVDGCGEFMPNGEEGTAEALKCAACHCHRSFHRREVESEKNPQIGANPYPPQHNGIGNSASSPRGITAPHNQQQVLAPFPPPQLVQRSPPLIVAFGGGAAAESSSEPVNSLDGTPDGSTPSSSSRKRFRTKFSQEQKDRMEEFGERMGWRILKEDEKQMEEFCAQVGVKRQVFKVWMHNSKQALKKKPLQETLTPKKTPIFGTMKTEPRF